MPPDVARVAIDGRKWIASRFHPNLLSEKLIGNITHHQESIQEQHLQALKNIMAKRKRRIEKEKKAKEERQLESAESKPWPNKHTPSCPCAWSQSFVQGDSTRA